MSDATTNIIGGDELVEIVTTGGHRIILDDSRSTVTLSSKDGLCIILDDESNKISIESFGSIELDAKANLSMKAGANVSISGKGKVDIKGAIVNIN